VKPQIIYDDRNGQNNTDPAINELGQGQHATKETKAKNQTEISVAPGGWYDPWRVGVGPTTIQATRTLAGAQSSNIQSQAYAQNATAHSGLVAEYADNTGSSRQTNGSDTDARNKVSVLYRTNANAPMSTTVVDHTAIAEDTNDQSHYGSQVASSVGAFGRSRNSAGTLQTNGQLVRSDMRVLIDV
jgi:hypothetical protein